MATLKIPSSGQYCIILEQWIGCMTYKKTRGEINISNSSTFLSTNECNLSVLAGGFTAVQRSQEKTPNNGLPTKLW